ncbi:helix-turn-helix domain-containing protein [Enterococcus italicus]|uniref:helix-turn-helix domain-containing protein n=1 Tax=Enterococcus italicus TaxID=246144 RepID=UPI002073E82A|nr:XRE family transcriptional regulator [Enterococcus italicus]
MIGDKMKKLRLAHKLTLEELAAMLNKKYPDTVNFNKGKLSKWENGKEEPKLSSIRILADFYNIKIDDFYIDSSTVSSSIETIYNKLEPPRQVKVYNFAKHQLEEQKGKKVHLYGATAANPQELSYGDTIYDETIETNVPKNADCALVVQGDSMEPEYKNGEIVFYKSQPVVENGEMAIVEINGDGVTLKKVYFNYDEDKVILRSLNNKYADRELNPDQVRILGKVVK